MLAWGGGRPGAPVAEPVERIAPRRPHGHHSPPTTKQRQAWLLWAALATGAGFRVLYYLSGRSLWIDEARLALNVAGRGYAGLLRPLDYDQAASPLFLWGEKLVTQLLGVNERAFWLLPLIAGLAAVALFVPVARRFLPGWPGVLVASSLCVAPTLIHFSTTAKPYIGDLAFALAMILGTAAWIERPRSRLARALPLLGVIAAWGSTPAIFSLVPAGAALLLGAPRERRGRAVLLLGFWLAAFGVAYAVVYGASAHSDYLQSFWRHAFVTPAEPRFESRLGGVRRDIFTAFSVGLYDPPTVALTVPEWFTQAQRFGSWLLAVVAAIGAARLIQARARWESVLLFGPVVLLGVASALSRYPASTRLVLFLVPVFYLSVAAGASALIASLPAPGRRMAGRVLIGLVFGSQLLMAIRCLRRCPTIEATREMVGLLGPVARAPQVVYVHAGALPGWAFYSTDWAHPDPVRLARFAALGASDGDSFENAASRGRVAPGEGWNLRFRAGSRTELLGVPAGVWRRPNVPHAGKVDVGWAENEVGRIKRAAGCRGIAWVLMAHSQGADAVLRRGLAAAGGRVTFEVLSLDASLTRVEFEPPAGDCFQR